MLTPDSTSRALADALRKLLRVMWLGGHELAVVPADAPEIHGAVEVWPSCHPGFGASAYVELQAEPNRAYRAALHVDGVPYVLATHAAPFGGEVRIVIVSLDSGLIVVADQHMSPAVPVVPGMVDRELLEQVRMPVRGSLRYDSDGEELPF